jgi:hypothetical protein
MLNQQRQERAVLVHQIWALGDPCWSVDGVLPPLAGHHHIGVATPATGTDEPLMPLGNRGLRAVSFGHFGGIRFDLMSAPSTPYDQTNTRRRRAPEGHRWAGFGFHLTASAESSAARRLITLRLGERFAYRFGADHVANLSQCPDAGREEIAILIAPSRFSPCRPADVHYPTSLFERQNHVLLREGRHGRLSDP